MINIQNIEKTQIYNKLYIRNINFILDNESRYCTVICDILNDENSITEIITLSKNEIDIWHEDDSILYNLVCEKLGLTILNV